MAGPRGFDGLQTDEDCEKVTSRSLLSFVLILSLFVGIRLFWDHSRSKAPSFNRLPLAEAYVYPEHRILLGVPFDINRATFEEIQAIPGLGPALSRRIVEDRALNGPFLSEKDLLRVLGIGPKTLQKIRPHIIAF